jgi:hypothetical protein
MVLLLVVLGTMHVTSLGDEPTKVEFCQLAANPQRYDLQIVSVEGLLRESDPSEDYYYNEFFVRGCPDSPTKEVAIRFVLPDREFLERAPPGYQFDEKSLAVVDEYLSTEYGDSTRPRTLPIVVEGVVVVPRVRASNGYHKPYPFSIVVQAVRLQPGVRGGAMREGQRDTRTPRDR